MAMLAGNSAKLIYGIDSMGNVCGAVNTFNGTEYDLRGAKKLHWLDPFEVTPLEEAHLHVQPRRMNA